MSSAIARAPRRLVVGSSLYPYRRQASAASCSVSPTAAWGSTVTLIDIARRSGGAAPLSSIGRRAAKGNREARSYDGHTDRSTPLHPPGWRRGAAHRAAARADRKSVV